MMGTPNGGGPEGLSDVTFGRVFSTGLMIGLPLMFVVASVMALGAGWPAAAGVAIVPTLFGAPFFGGLIVLMRALAADEAEDKAAKTESLVQLAGRGSAEAAA